MLRYEICFHPSWWHNTAGIDFSESFWFDPEARIRADVKMRRILFEKFGEYGIGEEDPMPRPILGSDLTACGFFLSEMLGCKVLYASNDSPQVICANLDEDTALTLQKPDFDASPVWQKVQRQLDYLVENYGHVQCHLNLSGVQNLAMDLRGQALFEDYYDPESPAENLLTVACETMLEAGRRLAAYSPYLSGGVTNILNHVRPTNFCTGNCTVEMVSNRIYEKFLLPYDIRLAEAFPDFGIHHCGQTMEHVAGGYARVPNLTFVEVGAFSDLAAVRDALPEGVLMNARYSPVRLAGVSAEDLRAELEAMVSTVPGERLSISCVGIDASVSDEKVRLFLSLCRELLGKEN